MKLMYKKVLFAIAFLIILKIQYLNTSVCVIDSINSNAIFLNTNFESIIPKKGIIHVKKDKNIVIACPGRKNFVKNSNETYSLAKCIKNNTFVTTDNILINIDNSICNKKVSSTILNTNEACGRNSQGNILQIGFNITDGIFRNIIQICVNENTDIPIYVTHQIYGNEIEYNSKNPSRPGFSTAGILKKGSSISVLYKQSFQTSNFNRIFKSIKQREKYVNLTSYIQRGHLAPKSDFIYETWQNGSFYYLNTAPQWAKINNGNWKKMELEIRNVSKQYLDPLNVVTGTHGILSLPDENGNFVPIYLDSMHEQYPVPKYFWKVVYDKTSQSGIAFVTVNNNFFEINATNDLLCGSTEFCTINKWGGTSWYNYKFGTIFCCQVDDLFEIVDHPDIYINIKNNMHGVQ